MAYKVRVKIKVLPHIVVLYSALWVLARNLLPNGTYFNSQV